MKLSVQKLSTIMLKNNLTYVKKSLSLEVIADEFIHGETKPTKTKIMGSNVYRNQSVTNPVIFFCKILQS
jgi:hypothetical protein